MAVTADGIAFITSGLKYPPYNTVTGADGAVYAFDLTDNDSRPEKVKILAPFDPYRLNPHGVTTFEPGDGRILVYVVNHGSKFEKLEKFEYHVEKNEMKWIKQFKHDSIYSLNDIHMISEDEFYFTNDQYFGIKNYFLRWLEYRFLLRFGSIGYCKHQKCQLATNLNLGYPNGLTVRIVDRENDEMVNKRQLLVTESRANRISVYDIDYTGTLTFSQTIPTSANMDNIFQDQDTVYVTGAPRNGYF